MPQLSRKKYPQEQLIADIMAGTSFVKVKPENIGDLIYFDSTNPKAAGKDPAEYARRRKKTLIIGAAALVLIWAVTLLFSRDYLFWPIVLTVIDLVAVFSIAVNQSFTGTDYFVGTEGFAEYEFKGSRENVEKSECRFDEDTVLILHEAKVYKKDSYDHTKYNFVVLGKPDSIGSAKPLFKRIGSYKYWVKDGNCRQAGLDFMYHVEKQLTTLVLDNAHRKLDAGEEVLFRTVSREKPGSDDWAYGDVIGLSPDAIRFCGEVFEGESLRQIKVKDSNLVFKSRELASGVFGRRTGDKVRVPLDSVGNLKAFLILLNKLYGI